MSEKFMFFENFKETADKLPDDLRLKFYDGLTNYVFKGVEPDDAVICALVNAIKPSLDKVEKRGGNHNPTGQNQYSDGQKEVKVGQSGQSFLETETEARNKKQESLKKNKQKEKISFSDVDDWESLFTYWEENKKGGRYKNIESRQRMLDRLKELTNHNLEFAKQAICHCIDNGYQGFSNGNELFYKTQKIPIKTIETKPDAFEVFHQAMSEIRRRAAQ